MPTETNTRSFKQKCQLVFRATKKHASNLARFATIYKLSMLALKHYGPTPGKEGTDTPRSKMNDIQLP